MDEKMKNPKMINPIKKDKSMDSWWAHNLGFF